jgi:hypothetical protein
VEGAHHFRGALPSEGGGHTFERVGCAKFRQFRIKLRTRDCAGAINLREFPAATAKRKSRLAGLLYSSILTPHSGYRYADNIIDGRSLTGYAIAL